MTPVTFADEAFDYIDVSMITIYVPKGSGTAYRNSEYYKVFRLQELENLDSTGEIDWLIVFYSL